MYRAVTDRSGMYQTMHTCVVTCLLLLSQVSVYALPHSLSQDLEEFSETLSLNFSKYRHKKGYSEHIVGNLGVVGLEHTAADGDDSLRIHELTNGTLIVKLIFAPTDTLSECDVSNSGHHIHRLLKHVTAISQYDSFRSTKNLTEESTDNFILQNNEENSNNNLTDILDWVERCDKLHVDMLGLENEGESNSQVAVSIIRERIKVGKSRVTSAQVGKSRDKRAFGNLVYPGKSTVFHNYTA